MFIMMLRVLTLICLGIAQSNTQETYSLYLSIFADTSYHCSNSTCSPSTITGLKTIRDCRFACLMNRHCRTASYHSSNQRCELFAGVPSQVGTLLSQIGTLTMTSTFDQIEYSTLTTISSGILTYVRLATHDRLLLKTPTFSQMTAETTTVIVSCTQTTSTTQTTSPTTDVVTTATSIIATVIAVSSTIAATTTTPANMDVARYEHKTILLPDGKVLVIGGRNTTTYSSSAEVYDPLTNNWTLTASMSTPRCYHAAALLWNGNVLVAGVVTDAVDDSRTDTTQLYRPISDNWSNATSMNSARAFLTLIALRTGDILAIGGMSAIYWNSVEMYNTSGNTWRMVASMSMTRTLSIPILLNDGRVLISGGSIGSTRRNTAELYDPTTNTWSAAGSIVHGRDWHTATLLSDGRVLVVGGLTPTVLAHATIYDASTNTWTTAASLNVARGGHTATLLPDGKVLVTGGYSNTDILNSVELYDPSMDSWSLGHNMTIPRVYHTATLMPNGDALLIGGQRTGSTAANSMEIYRFRHLCSIFLFLNKQC